MTTEAHMVLATLRDPTVQGVLRMATALRAVEVERAVEEIAAATIPLAGNQA